MVDPDNQSLLDRGTGNEKPFIHTTVNWRWRKIGPGGNFGQGSLINAFWRVRVGGIGTGVAQPLHMTSKRHQDLQIDVTGSLLARDQSLPRVAAFADYLHSVLLVLALTAEGELVLWLSVWNFVNAEPFVSRS